MSVADDVRVLGAASNQVKSTGHPAREAYDRLDKVHLTLQTVRDKLAWVRGDHQTGETSDTLWQVERYLIIIQEKLRSAQVIAEEVERVMPSVAAKIDEVAANLTS